MKKVSNVLGKIAGTAASVGSMAYLASAVMAESATGFISDISGASSPGLIPFIRSALNLVIALAALVAVGILVYSGIQYILASGDEGKIEKATKGITYAIVGLIICFISVLIVNFVLTQVLKVS